MNPFEEALKKYHKGYNAMARKTLNIKEPDTPEQAIRDLMDSASYCQFYYLQITAQATLDSESGLSAQRLIDIVFDDKNMWRN